MFLSVSNLVFSATIISPIEMIRTRIQSGQLTYTQLLARISTGVTQNGWLSLWKGWGPTILRDVPFSGMTSFKNTYFYMCWLLQAEDFRVHKLRILGFTRCKF